MIENHVAARCRSSGLRVAAVFRIVLLAVLMATAPPSILCGEEDSGDVASQKEDGDFAQVEQFIEQRKRALSEFGVELRRLCALLLIAIILLFIAHIFAARSRRLFSSDSNPKVFDSDDKAGGSRPQVRDRKRKRYH